MIHFQWFKRIASGASLVALIVSALMNVSLVKKLHAVEERSRPGLHAGDIVPAVPVVARDGSKLIDANQPTLIYHFSASCGWCERNWANIAALADQTKGRLHVVAVSIAPLPEGFLAARGINIDVADNLPASTVKAYKLAATPQSILVGADNRIVNSWFGAYSGPFAKEVESVFRVHLPGLEIRKQPIASR